MATWPIPAGSAAASTNVNELNQRVSNTVESIGLDTVDPQETRTSNSYGDLNTAGPSVTVTCPSSKALVFVTARAQNRSSGERAFMSFTVTGASTVAADDARSYEVPTNINTGATRVVALSSLSTGSNTFTAKYRVSTTGSTGAWQSRSLVVFPLGK